MDRNFVGGKNMKNKLCPATLIFVLSVFWLIFCTLDVFAQIKMKDLARREVEIPESVERIVCAGPGSLRIIVYLNAQNKVVGVEDAERRWGPSGRPYAIACKELANLPSIGPGGPGKLPDMEALVKLNLDIIFMTYVDTRIADNIQAKTGIPVFVLSYGETAEFGEPLFKSFELAGYILGKERRAREVTNFIKECLDDLKKRTENIPDEKKPTVYVGGLGYKGVHGIESSWANFPLFDFVNAKNVVNGIGKEGHVFIDRERLVSWDPDIIFVDEGGLELVRQDYQKRPEFYRLLKAYREEAIYGILPFNFYTTNIGTALADAYYIGKVLYPDIFGDIKPEENADRIYLFLVGKRVYREMKKDFGGFVKINLEEKP